MFKKTIPVYNSVMSEELLQRDLLANPEKMGGWEFYNIGATSIRSLKRFNIIRDIDYGLAEAKKVDGIIVSQKNVLAVIEYKKPSEFKSQAQQDKAVQQELFVAEALSAPIFIATDTLKTIWINAKTGNPILDEKGNEVKDSFSPKNSSTINLMKKILSSINEHNDQIKPRELVNPTKLASQIWQDVWSVSGATPENCLYTFVELFIFKYLSDLGVLKGVYSFSNLMNSYATNTDEEVLETYAKIVRPQIKILFPEGSDGTTIINGTIFVSKDQKAVRGYSTVFKKVLTRFHTYGHLENIDYDFKSKLFESFLKESISKKNWGQFFTPLKVVQAIGEMAEDEIKPGIKICDPACGVGKFLLEPILKKIDQFYSVENGQISSSISITGFDKGFDKDEQKTIILAKANMLIYFSDLIKENPSLTEKFAKLFNESFTLKTNSILGTLSEPSSEEFDLILTNPPYVTSGSSNLKEEVRKSGLEYYYDTGGVGVESLFMEWIIKSLKPGGKAFVIVPDGILTRSADSQLRKQIMDTCTIDALISLPSKTFFTTLKKTYILVITKKASRKQLQNEPIFTYLVSDIGETLDIYRMEKAENDLNEAAILYKQFKGAKSYFKSEDPRFKSIPFSWFEANVSKTWKIEDAWTNDELVSIGLKTESTKLGVTEFTSYLAELGGKINEYSASVSNSSLSERQYKEVNLTDPAYFKVISGGLGFKKNEYSVLNSANSDDIPVYTATLLPVSFFRKDSVKRAPYYASEVQPHVSFASDGDGTAGTNIVYHDRPYYINTSRTAFESNDVNIDMRYVYYLLQGIKQKYGFDYKHKATLNNIKKVTVRIPVKSDGSFDLEAQKEITSLYELINEVQTNLREDLTKISDNSIEI